MYSQLNWSAIISKGGHYKNDEAIKYLNLKVMKLVRIVKRKSARKKYFSMVVIFNICLQTKLGNSKN